MSDQPSNDLRTARDAYRRPIAVQLLADGLGLLIAARRTFFPVGVYTPSIRLLKHHKAAGRSCGFLFELT